MFLLEQGTVLPYKIVIVYENMSVLSLNIYITLKNNTYINSFKV